MASFDLGQSEALRSVKWGQKLVDVLHKNNPSAIMKRQKQAGISYNSERLVYFPLGIVAPPAAMHGFHDAGDTYTPEVYNPANGIAFTGRRYRFGCQIREEDIEDYASSSTNAGVDFVKLCFDQTERTAMETVGQKYYDGDGSTDPGEIFGLHDILDIAADGDAEYPDGGRGDLGAVDATYWKATVTDMSGADISKSDVDTLVDAVSAKGVEPTCLIADLTVFRRCLNMYTSFFQYTDGNLVKTGIRNMLWDQRIPLMCDLFMPLYNTYRTLFALDETHIKTTFKTGASPKMFPRSRTEGTFNFTEDGWLNFFLACNRRDTQGVLKGIKA